MRLTLICALLGVAGSAPAMGQEWWRSTTAAMPTSVTGIPDPGASSPAPSPDAEVAQSAESGDPAAAYRSALAGRIQAVLDAQAAALLAGDEAAFLASADQSLRSELKRRFGVLRAMKVAGWAERVVSRPEPVPGTGTPPRWRVGVQLRYCFAVPSCSSVGVTVQSEWVEVGDVPRLVSMAPSTASDMGPRPWEVTDLRVAVGNRVVVAATPRYAYRLTGALAAAEKAAAVTDRYARWRPAPGRYLVYLAGPDEWGRWYGVPQAPWVAGYAMPVSDTSTEIVINAQRVGNSSLSDALRHEFTHAVTLAGIRRDVSAQWWLVEGIAEYVRMADRGIDRYAGLSATKRYVRSGRWSGEIIMAEPPAGSSSEDASGRYGIAFLTVRRIAEKYGEKRLMEFFDAVVRHGGDPSVVARTTLGTPWNDVRADCISYIRKKAGSARTWRG